MLEVNSAGQCIKKGEMMGCPTLSLDFQVKEAIPFFLSSVAYSSFPERKKWLNQWSRVQFPGCLFHIYAAIFHGNCCLTFKPAVSEWQPHIIPWNMYSKGIILNWNLFFQFLKLKNKKKKVTSRTYSELLEYCFFNFITIIYQILCFF